MASQPFYSSVPLENNHSIRLLSFTAEHVPDAPISVKLEVVDLDEDPEYVTLSYCWGPPLFSHAVQRHEDPGEKGAPILLHITKTLHHALVHLRKHLVRRIWIDQICINQKDVDERSAQVAEMGRIYQHSSHTYLYLGELGDEPKVTESEIAGLGKMLEVGGADSLEFRLSSLVAVFRSSFAFLHLTQRPLFRRKWIIQEVVLSRKRTFLIGLYQLPWSFFENGDAEDSFENLIPAGLVSSIKSLGPEEGQRVFDEYMKHPGFIIKMANWREKQESQMSLIQLIKLSRFFDASDEQDFVYALLGLANDAGAFRKPNYKVPKEQAFADLAKTLLKMGQGQDALSLAGLRRNDAKAPSWVADWSSLSDTYVPLHWHLYHASSEAQIIGFDETEKVLLTKSRICHKITAVSRSLKDVKYSPLSSYLDACQDAFRQHLTPSQERHPVFRAAMRLLTTNETDSDSGSDSDGGPDGGPDSDSVSRSDKADAKRPKPVKRANSAEFETRVPPQEVVHHLLMPKSNLSRAAWIPIAFYHMGLRAADNVLKDRRSKAAGFGRGLLSRITPSTETGKGFFFQTSAEETLAEIRQAYNEGDSYTPSRTFDDFDEHAALHLFSDTRVMLYGDKQLGFAPATAEVGDEVCVIAGMSCPFLLRSCSAGYRLVGPCYAPGFMKGEACRDDRFPSLDIRIV